MTVNTQELRELAEKATPGPWHAGTECPGRCCWHIFTGLPIYGAPQYEGDDGQPVVMNECSEDDAAFMVAARNALPALLAENERLERACRLAVMALAHACQESERGEALYGKTYKAVSDALYSPAPPQGETAC